LELCVSSARISVYIEEIPGACAVIGTAASSNKQKTLAHNFFTVPPKFLGIFSAGSAKSHANIRKFAVTVEGSVAGNL
jgi:hypothetical protein